jgi:hypothetical protein
VREATLTCHPRTPTHRVRAIVVHVSRTPAGVLHLGYALAGDVDALRVPAPRAAAQGRDLWRHTCFEAFVGGGDEPAYHELNFAPSRAWAVLAFGGYRDGGQITLPAAPRIAVRRTADRLELDAEVRLTALSPVYRTAPLRLALAAVVEDAQGALSYWSLHHPAGAPDFHHVDAFTLRLERPDDAC